MSMDPYSGPYSRSVSFVVEPTLFRATALPGGPGATDGPYSSFGQIMDSHREAVDAIIRTRRSSYPGTVRKRHRRGTTHLEEWLPVAGDVGDVAIQVRGSTRRSCERPAGLSSFGLADLALPDHYLASATEFEGQRGMPRPIRRNRERGLSASI